jgi:hypothetical protein
MTIHVLLLLFICLIFFIIDRSSLDSYSSKGLSIFKFVFSICFSFFLSHIATATFTQYVNEYSEIYKFFIIYVCSIIVFIGIEMLTYGKMGSKEYR